MDKYKIIDAHAHVYPEAIAEKASENLGHFYNFKIQGKGTYNDLETKTLKMGADGFFLLCVATNAKQVEKVNTTIAELCRLATSKGLEAYGFAGMHQDYPDFEKEVDRCTELGLCGIKLHPDIQRADVDCESFLRLYEILEKKHMKLFLHAGDDRKEFQYSSPDKIAKVAKMFPDMPIVAAHLGGYKAWDAAEEYLCGKFDNVWYDCSSALWAMSPERAKHMIEACGYDKVMFGTDYPVCDLDEYIDLFMKVDLTDDQRRDIFYNNAKRFIAL